MFKRIAREIKQAVYEAIQEVELDRLNEEEMFGEEDSKYTKMTREQLAGVDIFVADLESLPKDKQIDILNAAHSLKNSAAFNFIFDSLIQAQTQDLVVKAIDRDQYLFARFSINGISLVKELVEDLAGKCELLTKVDKFDNKEIT